MSPDKLDVTIESKEIDISTQETANVEVTIDSYPDTFVEIPTGELKVEVESNEIELQVDDKPIDVDFAFASNPDIIVLASSGFPGPPGPYGPTGPEGPQGITGPTGPPGVDQTYIFTQVAAIASWNIKHDLNRYPSVTVVDTGGSEIIPHLTYINANEVTLSFANPTSGTAYLN